MFLCRGRGKKFLRKLIVIFLNYKFFFLFLENDKNLDLKFQIMKIFIRKVMRINYYDTNLRE